MQPTFYCRPSKSGTTKRPLTVVDLFHVLKTKCRTDWSVMLDIQTTLIFDVVATPIETVVIKSTFCNGERDVDAAYMLEKLRSMPEDWPIRMGKGSIVLGGILVGDGFVELHPSFKIPEGAVTASIGDDTSMADCPAPPPARFNGLAWNVWI